MHAYHASATAGPRCSVLARQLGEPLAGTAAGAATWLCIEQPGPWGRDALVQSHLEVAIGRELAERAAGTGVRIALIRRPGSHPDRHQPLPHLVYLAHTAPGWSWLERMWVGDPKELLDLDFAAAGAGEPSGVGELTAEPVLLVCTNGRRDVCCALLGRPIATALAGRYGSRVWECTHLGGHRFSPTALVLPYGYSYGRLEVASAQRLLASRSVLIEHCRGRSTWRPAAQVADLAVRAAIAERDPDAVRAGEPAPAGADRQRVLVSHVDGRRWEVTVAERAAPAPRSASCGAAPKPSTELHAEGIRPLTQ
jgi:hypothetical protein